LSSSITINVLRDNKGRFRSPNKNELPPIKKLSNKVHDVLIGNLLGDGHLRFTKKDIEGKPKPNANALFSITLKNKEYIYFLWENCYKSICTDTLPRPWPPIKSGKPTTQYNFNSRSLPSITLLHKQWYKWLEEEKKFKKVVPVNIMEILTPIGLAHWIMDDGYKSGNGLVLCTESFSTEEVNLLKNILELKFGLKVSLHNRKSSSGKLGYRLAISSISKKKLIELVRPYFVNSMLYKLGL
jgi:hypothetical protein